MQFKEAVARLIIQGVGLFSKITTVELLKETNAIRLIPFDWFIRYLKLETYKRGITQYVDIGTNNGKEMRKIIIEIGNFKSTHAIEPNPEMAKQLREDFPNVEIHSIAVGEEDTEANLAIPIDKEGNKITVAASINKNISQEFENCVEYTVEIKRPLSINIDWSLPSFIKIDAEGAELIILKELMPLLNPASIVSVEDHWAIMPTDEQKDYKYTFKSLAFDLKSKGILFTKWL